MATYQWTGAGNDGQFTDPLNWSSNIVPGAGDQAEFTATTGSETVNGNGATTGEVVVDTGNSLTLTGDLTTEGVNDGNTGSGVPENGDISGSLTIASGATFVGQGTDFFIRGSGALTVHGSLSGDSLTSQSSGQISVSGQGAVLSEGDCGVQSGSLSVTDHGEISASSRFYFYNTLFQLDDTATLNVPSIQLFSSPTISALVDGASNTHQVVTISKEILYNGPYTVTLESAPGVTLDVTGSVEGFSDPIEGNSTLSVSHGTVVLDPSSFSGVASLTVGAGATLLADGALTGLSAVTVANGATLGGGGTVGGPVTEDGTLSASAVGFATSGTGTGPSYGALTTGALTMAGTSSLDEEIGGTTAGTSYDTVKVQGNATIGGTLDLSAVSGSAYGDVFTVLTASGGLTGAFGNAANGSTMTAGGRTFAVAYADGGNGTAGTVTLTDTTATSGAPTIATPTNGADTNDRTIAGTGTAGDTIDLTIDGAAVTPGQPIVVGQNGQWSYVATGLADGQHTVSAAQTAPGDGPSASSTPDTFTLDTTDPIITSIADSGPGVSANGSGDLDAGHTVTLTVTTSEPVTVTAGPNGALPTLTLNDGGTATYTGPVGTPTSTGTFSYRVVAGQNTANLAVTAVNGNGATVTDAAGNPLSPSLAGTTMPSGTLTIDTTPPVASSPTLTVAQNSGATPIGIAAPTDNLTPTGSLAVAAGTLPTDGTVTLADGATPVTAGEALTAAQLQGLEFTPTPGASNAGSTFTYTVTDGAGNSTTGTAALNIGSPGAPTITGTHASATTSEAPVQPFAGVTVGDPSAATETLTIGLTGAGGTLAGTGLAPGANGTYSLTGSAATVTGELDALTFTPTAGAAGTTSTTRFVLTDASSAGTSVADSGTGVTDTDPAVTPPAPDAVSISSQVTDRQGAFTISGTASSAAGVSSVEISAAVNGTVENLGAATVAANGTFTFSDLIGASTQGFITATETDGAGGTASALAAYSLQGGLDVPDGGRAPFVAEQDLYTADGSAITAVADFRGDGSANQDASRRTTIEAPGQTFVSDQFDDYRNNGNPETTFVFNPNHGLDTISLFRAGGTDHDTLSFSGSDFGNSIANVLRDTHQTAGGSSIIVDPTTHDAVKLVGITKKEFAATAGQDVTFHA